VPVRRELPSDRDAARAVHLAAFATSDGRHAVEARLLDELRDEGDLLPELGWVVTHEGGVVAHVACSRSVLGADSTSAVALGPIGVLPGHQRRGAGSALVHAGLGGADARGFHVVVLLGSPAYYGRFGFVPAASLGIEAADPLWGNHFQARPLTAWDGTRTGAFRYAPAFDRL